MPDTEENQALQYDDISVGTTKFVFDKDTFLSKEVRIEMTLDHQESGMKTTMNIHSVMNAYNSVDDIVVPADVKESSDSSIQMPGMGEMMKKNN